MPFTSNEADTETKKQHTSMWIWIYSLLANSATSMISQLLFTTIFRKWMCKNIECYRWIDVLIELGLRTKEMSLDATAAASMHTQHEVKSHSVNTAWMNEIMEAANSWLQIECWVQCIGINRIESVIQSKLPHPMHLDHVYVSHLHSME